jgi:GDP-L-fucose synthase
MEKLRRLEAEPVSCSRRTGCDLRHLEQALRFFEHHRPELVINCASNQGGIAYQEIAPGKIYYDNLLMGANTMEAARLAGVEKYVNIIAGCAYPATPRDETLREDELDAGPMHPTVENYGATKRAAVAQAKAYRYQYDFDAISLILINLYGPGEHFHPDRSHALAALLRKFHDSRQLGLAQVSVWGTGRPDREWLYVEDAAEGILRAAERYDDAEPLNIAVGTGQPISELASIIAEITGYQGEIVYDPSKPDGAMKKTADIEKMKRVLGWVPPTPLRDGIRLTWDWLIKNYEQATGETL